jgi:hypothetical protein
MPRIARTVAMALGLAGGLSASQGPEFAQQYRQRLGGAIDELRRVVARFESDARAVGETRDGALRRLGANADELARRQGEAARGPWSAWSAWKTSAAPWSKRAPSTDAGSGAPGRPRAAARGVRDYRPGLQMTEEGLFAGAPPLRPCSGAAPCSSAASDAQAFARRRPRLNGAPTRCPWRSRGGPETGQRARPRFACPPTPSSSAGGASGEPRTPAGEARSPAAPTPLGSSGRASLARG